MATDATVGSGKVSFDGIGLKNVVFDIRNCLQ
jgi:hypothetical protein